MHYSCENIINRARLPLGLRSITQSPPIQADTTRSVDSTIIRISQHAQEIHKRLQVCVRSSLTLSDAVVMSAKQRLSLAVMNLAGKPHVVHGPRISLPEFSRTVYTVVSHFKGG